MKFPVGNCYLTVISPRCASLEIVCTPNKGTGGSNPPLSAIQNVSMPLLLFEISFLK
jgi:hypothetical protein